MPMPARKHARKHAWKIALAGLCCLAASDARSQADAERRMMPTRLECPNERDDGALLYEAMNRFGSRVVWVVVYEGRRAVRVEVFAQHPTLPVKRTRIYDLDDELDAASRADAQTFTDAANFLKRQYCDGSREALDAFRANLKGYKAALENRR
jgi:hypothetical protein